KIHRQSDHNEVATRISTKKVDNSALQGSMNQLRALSLKNASDKEIKSYWQNRLIIAEKTKNLSEVRLCARKIIGFKFFNKKEKERARELIVWSNEMEFRFKAAYESAKKLTSYQTKTSQFQLKLAVLAELGGQKSAAEKHYRSFIKKTPSLRKANQVRAQLIEKSRRPWRELEKNLAKLKRTPDILSTALMQAYYKKRDKKKLDKILRSSKANRYPEGKALQRLLVIDEINKFNKEISRHRITSRNMNKSLPERLKLLKKAENWASRLSKQNDWTLQILAVDIVAKQNSRTYRNILALRTPKGLNAQQRAEYQTLLKQKASAFSQKAGIANTTLDRLWNQAESWTQIESEIAIANKAARSLMVNELSELKKRATSKGKEKITQIIVKKATKPSQKALVSAYVEAKKDPFDWKIIERIKNMETQFDRKTLVNYLESRMNELKKGAL
ncbi:MAG: hypothetical protein HRT44_04230, partial [Bdellovibrionales bacterium]|nr:hypothetical protein [Bdellovibrionales bacterium]NQZ18451.1 hypothetical protein [Bdellovibrionales bacterium]